MQSRLLLDLALVLSLEINIYKIKKINLMHSIADPDLDPDPVGSETFCHHIVFKYIEKIYIVVKSQDLYLINFKFFALR